MYKLYICTRIFIDFMMYSKLPLIVCILSGMTQPNICSSLLSILIRIVYDFYATLSTTDTDLIVEAQI